MSAWAVTKEFIDNCEPGSEFSVEDVANHDRNFLLSITGYLVSLSTLGYLDKLPTKFGSPRRFRKLKELDYRLTSSRVAGMLGELGLRGKQKKLPRIKLPLD